MFLVRTWTLAILLLFTSAGSPLLAGEGSASGWPAFVGVSENAGVPLVHRASATPKKFLLETMGSGVALLDYDGDGDLDLLVGRYMQWNFDDVYCGRSDLLVYCDPKHFPAISNLLYRNDGDGTLTDVTRSSGIGNHPSRGLGVAFNDFDRAGRPDIVVANDGVPQSLFLNQGHGAFREEAPLKGLAFDEIGNTFAGLGGPSSPSQTPTGGSEDAGMRRRR